MLPGVDLAESADFVARMILSLITSPGSADPHDPAAVRVLVRTQVLAGILDPAALSGS